METLLQVGLGNAVTASVLAVVAACVSRVCRRPALTHCLWLVVLLKLVTPSPLALPVQLPSSVPVLTASLESAAATERFWSAALPEGLADWVEEYWMLAILGLWMLGSCLWFTLAGLRSYHFARLLRFGKPASPELQAQAEQLARELGLRRCPVVRMMPGLLSPMLWGLGRQARLLLPAELMPKLDPDQVRTVLVHELAHARRRDPWVRVVELFALGLYWWLPTAWWIRRRLREAEEQCCDAWVVATLPGSATSYAKALVETVAFLSTARTSLPPMASGVGRVHSLERRLTLILFGAPPKQASILGLVAVSGLAVALLPWRPVWGIKEDETPETPVAVVSELKSLAAPNLVQIAEAQPGDAVTSPVRITTVPPVVPEKAAPVKVEPKKAVQVAQESRGPDSRPGPPQRPRPPRDQRQGGPRGGPSPPPMRGGPGPGPGPNFGGPPSRPPGGR